MGTFDGISSKAKSTFAPLTNAYHEVVHTARHEANVTLAKLEKLGHDFEKPFTKSAPMPKFFEKAWSEVREFVNYAIPTFGQRKAPDLVDTRSRFDTPVRGADEIRRSGALEEFAKLKDVKVPKSELNRNIEHDAVLV